MRKEKGFTLVEILIVVAIIAILASIVLVGLGPFRSRGRDTRRIADLSQVQNGLELYFTKNGVYPDASDWATLTATLKAAGIGVNSVPNDPTPTANYVYGLNSDKNSYVLGAKLEDGSNPALNSDIDGTVYGVNCDDPVYCIQF